MKPEKLIRGCIIMIGLSLGLTTVAHAHSVKTPYEMAVILDAAQGSAVRAGNYEKAIARLEPGTRRHGDRFAYANNLCVGYTMMERFDEAAQACDTALELALKKAPGRAWRILSPRVRDRAMALSNLAVLKLLTGDVGAAREHLAEAVALGTALRQPVRNLRRLDSKDALIAAQ